MRGRLHADKLSVNKLRVHNLHGKAFHKGVHKSTYGVTARLDLTGATYQSYSLIDLIEAEVSHWCTKTTYTVAEGRATLGGAVRHNLGRG